MRRQILRSGRTVLTGAALLALLALFFIPWTGTVRVPAVALAEQEFAIFAPRPARIETLALVDGGHVASGDQLAVLVSPGLTHQIIKARHNIALAQARLERAPADSRDLASRSVIARTLATERARLAGFLEEQRRMVIKAPMAGEVRDVRIDVAAGEWIDEEAPLARIVSGKGREARGYVHEDDLWKLVPGQSAVFVPEDPLITSRQGRLRDVAPAGSRAIELPYVASVFGGAIPSDRTSEGEIRPRAGRYQIIVRLDGAPLDRAVRGTLLLDGRPESLAAAFWRRLLQVLVRESGV